MEGNVLTAIFWVCVGAFVVHFVPAFAKGVAGLCLAKRDSEERALGRQPVDQQNEAHKADLSQHGQLRIAAMDKRMQAHQDAFYQWTRLRDALHSQQITIVAGECMDWWNKNCLYLEPASREAFNLAVVMASNHASLVEQSRHGDLKRDVQDSFKKIMNAPVVLQADVELPTIKPQGLNEVEALPKA